ncbi:hypothetical protein [Stieleria bergensis]|uniref:hypothetical protein n=1 Tax=Stieleria bergensis TaxID=2528025 RepID=UPI003AF352EB
MILPRLCETLRNESADDFGVGLDQFCDVGIVGCFGDVNSFVRALDDHLDLVRVLKEFAEQEVTHSYWFGLFDADFHPANVFLNFRRDLGVIRLRGGLHTVGNFFDGSLDLVVIVQQEVN